MMAKVLRIAYSFRNDDVFKGNQTGIVTCYARKRVNTNQPFRTVITFVTLVAYLISKWNILLKPTTARRLPPTRLDVRPHQSAEQKSDDISGAFQFTIAFVKTML